MISETVGNTVPLRYSSTFTSRTKQMHSPLQGRTMTYLESYTIRVTSPKGSMPNLEAVKNKINTDCAAGTPDSGNVPIDAVCDSVLLIQGAVVDTYKFRTWVAETQSAAFAQANQTRIARLQGQTLIAPIVAFAVIAVAFIISAAIVLIVVVVLGWMSFMSVANALMPGKPSYVGGSPDTPQVFDDVAAYQSSQNMLYWHVCPKCYTGFALKSSYPTIDPNNPAYVAEKAAFDEHSENCLGIPKTSYDVTMLVIWVIVGVSAVVAVAYLLPKIFRSARPTHY